MRKVNAWFIVIFLATYLSSFQVCAMEQVPLNVEKSLPQSQLAYFNDSFDKLREDIWEKAAGTYNKAQLAKFKLADVSIDDGKLKIETKTGYFSKGGRASKYALRGDFDIQLDCHIDFLEGLRDMDQQLVMLVVDKTIEVGRMNLAVIGLLKKGGHNRIWIYSGCRNKGRYQRGNSQEIGNFHGTLRMARSDDKITTFYSIEGDIEWKKLSTLRCTKNDVMVGFALQNFHPRRTSITATSPLTARFDNFKINAAQEIIEEEI